jgi:hypothetical protein
MRGTCGGNTGQQHLQRGPTGTNGDQPPSNPSKNGKLEKKPKRVPGNSFVDTDPVRSETFSRIRIEIQIREKTHSGSGQLGIRNEFEIKLTLKS